MKTKLKHRIARRLLKITSAQVEEKERFGAYIEMVTNGIPREQRETRNRMKINLKKTPPAPWFQKYI